MTVDRAPSENHQAMIKLLDEIRAQERADPPPTEREGEEWLAWVKRQIDRGASCTMPDWA